MAVSKLVLAITIFLHVFAFVFAVGAERRRSKATVEPDEYDEKEYCVYSTDASTVYGLTAFGLLLISQMLVNGATRCLCFGRRMMGSNSTTCVVFFIFSWISFLAAEACLLAGSARNAYHTKYRVIFHVQHLSCATLRKGVFAAAAALTLVSMTTTFLYYWSYSKANSDGGWIKHQNEGLGLTSSNYTENQHHHKANEFEKV